MILDKIENIHLHESINSRIYKALQYIKNTDFSFLDNGKYDIDENIFAIVNRYNTIPVSEEKLEAHRKYIDVQFVYEGNEYIAFAIKNNQEVYAEYNKEEDFELFNGDFSLIKFNKGMFSIFFPDDLHAPGVYKFKTDKVTKVVVKVLID